MYYALHSLDLESGFLKNKMQNNNIDRSRNRNISLKRSYNRYDIMIFLVIASQAFGYIGGFFSPGNLLVILFLPFLLNCMKGNGVRNNLRPFFLVFIFWSIYNLMSTLWAPQMNRAIYHSILLLINFIMFLEILVFCEKAHSPHNNIAISWLLAFFATSLVAIWELKTGNHLSNAKDDYLGRETAMEDLPFGTYVAVGFYNFNTYCLYILQVFPFVLYTLANKASRKLELLALYCGLMSMLFVLVNGSRGSSMSLALMFAIFLLLMMKGGKRGVTIALAIAVIVIILFVLYGDTLLAVILYRTQNGSMFEDNSRIVLWEKSMELFYNSFGIGTGVGSMVPAMTAQGNSYSIYYTHNMFIELLMQFGVVITLLVCYYFYNLYIRVRKQVYLPNKILLYSALASLPLYSIVNSEYTHIRFIWCYFATLFVYASSYSSDYSLIKYDNNK